MQIERNRTFITATTTQTCIPETLVGSGDRKKEKCIKDFIEQCLMMIHEAETYADLNEII
jgi:hypothetical protein